MPPDPLSKATPAAKAVLSALGQVSFARQFEPPLRLCASFEAAHTPDRHIAVDESVICRVSFQQYLKGKTNPWGIKAYILSESKSGYLRVCIMTAH